VSQRQERLERLVPRFSTDGENPFVDDVRHPATPVVLEAIDTGREFRERPVSVLCPGCGDVLTRHPDGLPVRVARVSARCEDCATTLQRWAVVAIGTAYEQAPSPARLRRTLTDYWDARLWAGIITGEDNPRTREYSRRYTDQAAAFDWDWTVSCPLCRTAVADLDVDRLDYHHWQRDPDQGVCLCRTATMPSTASRPTKRWTGRLKKSACVTNTTCRLRDWHCASRLSLTVRHFGRSPSSFTVDIT
jgi:hypothetical protein